ncbi:DNA gyrase inhibitor YacG [Sphingomonas aerophila]|jgi:endogenous inhibitor of DNA gyrase (YacG/DUF329 family)|uniref:DNA gyrase inhibitor YacG n=1 Tax=Sphingomonas aerophila TaxID=1344948 RepID=A0A7W9EVU0_9SPHN|nr:DNA gyrase inhibitor YacG [Sphingomonas aerophila]MBB5715042.1 hypothetical protein [Sphingomonas aerophila]
MTAQTCPTCGKPTAAEFRPFCSRGCKDRDLLAWLSESYRLPGREPMHDGLDTDENPD